MVNNFSLYIKTYPNTSDETNKHERSNEKKHQVIRIKRVKILKLNFLSVFNKIMCSGKPRPGTWIPEF